MKIATTLKIFVCLIVSVSVVFSCIGYAALTDDIKVNGSIAVKEITGLYIIDYTWDGQYDENIKVLGHVGTVISSTVTLPEGEQTSNTTEDVQTTYTYKTSYNSNISDSSGTFTQTSAGTTTTSTDTDTSTEYEYDDATGKTYTVITETVVTTETTSNNRGTYVVGDRTYRNARQNVVKTTTTTTVTRQAASQVTYTVTIYNNSPDIYYFDDVTHVQDYYDNQGIAYSYEITQSADASDPTKIEPKQSMDIDLTFTFSDNADMDNTTLNSTLSFNFLLEKESIEEAIKDAIDMFRVILNDDVDFNFLLTHIDDKYDGTDWKANFIGNVAGSSLEDTTNLVYLFDGYLNLIIDGVETPITLLIKMEDLDGNENTGCMYSSSYTDEYGNTYTTSGIGCEMALYITTDDISENNSALNKRANPVYAIVFTCETTYTRDSSGEIVSAEYGDWIQLGDRNNNNGMYTGTAVIVGYEGNEMVEGVSINSGSFNTGDWRLSSTHQISGNVAIGSGATIQRVIELYIQEYGYTTVK